MEKIKDKRRMLIFPELYYGGEKIFDTVKIYVDSRRYHELPNTHKVHALKYYNEKYLPSFIKYNVGMIELAKDGDLGTEPNTLNLDKDDIDLYPYRNKLLEYKDIMFFFEIISNSMIKKTKYGTDITDVGYCILNIDPTQIRLSSGPIQIEWRVTEPKYITMLSPCVNDPGHNEYTNILVDMPSIYRRIIDLENAINYVFLKSDSILYKMAMIELNPNKTF